MHVCLCVCVAGAAQVELATGLLLVDLQNLPLSHGSIGQVNIHNLTCRAKEGGASTKQGVKDRAQKKQDIINEGTRWAE